MKRILYIALWVVFVFGVFTAMGFAHRSHNRQVCAKPQIHIDRKVDQEFITENMILDLLREKGDTIEGQMIQDLDVSKLEQLMEAHAAVEKAEVFMDVNGQVSIRLLERRPIARVITGAGESYYIDDRGLLMPWSAEYTAQVIPVTGAIFETYGGMYKSSLIECAADTIKGKKTQLDEVWQLMTYIDADTFFRAQIVQVNITPDRVFELIPRIGDHKIILGTISPGEEGKKEIDLKLRKLFLFYREGLNRTGNWNDYSIIDLQYLNQIVCTKKITDHGI
jgi:cell division protein FtsQ